MITLSSDKFDKSLLVILIYFSVPCWRLILNVAYNSAEIESQSIILTVYIELYLIIINLLKTMPQIEFQIMNWRMNRLYVPPPPRHKQPQTLECPLLRNCWTLIKFNLYPSSQIRSYLYSYSLQTTACTLESNINSKLNNYDEFIVKI